MGRRRRAGSPATECGSPSTHPRTWGSCWTSSREPRSSGAGAPCAGPQAGWGKGGERRPPARAVRDYDITLTVVIGMSLRAKGKRQVHDHERSKHMSEDVFQQVKEALPALADANREAGAFPYAFRDGGRFLDAILDGSETMYPP